MKVVHVSTYDIRGGAARCAYRVHMGLLRSGIDSKFLTLRRFANEAHVGGFPPSADEELRLNTQATVESTYFDGNRTEISNTLFSFDFVGCDISNHPWVRDADIVHLNWVNAFLSPLSIAKLAESGKALAWTFYDQWAFTGGCHYTAGCEGYKAECMECPQLREDRLDLVMRSLALKKAIFSGTPIHLITPSRWMAECVSKSAALSSKDVSIVPSCLETEIFAPGDVEANRRHFGIGPEDFVILFGCELESELRKGFADLQESLEACNRNQRFSEGLREGRIRLMQFGYTSKKDSTAGIPLTSTGHIEDDRVLARCYSAADVIVVPSHEDNFPNTALEALACGTPVIAYQVGGLPEMIEHGVTGYLVEDRNTQELAEWILQMYDDRSKVAEMSARCREVACSRYSLEVQTRRILEVYRSILSKARLAAPVEACPSKHCDDLWNSLVTETLPRHVKKLDERIELIERDRAARLTAIQDAHREVRETRRELQETRRELQETRRELQETRGELEVARNDLQAAYRELQVHDEYERRLCEAQKLRDVETSETRMQVESAKRSLAWKFSDAAWAFIHALRGRWWTSGIKHPGRSPYASVERGEALIDAVEGTRLSELSALRSELDSVRKSFAYRWTDRLTRAVIQAKNRKAGVPAPQVSVGVETKRAVPTAERGAIASAVALLEGVRDVLFLSASERNLELRGILSEHCLQMTCFDSGAWHDDSNRTRVTLIKQSFGDWLATHETGLFEFDLIVVDATHDLLWREWLLQRLSSHQRILLHGAETEMKEFPMDCFIGTEGPGFRLHYAPPRGWLDTEVGRHSSGLEEASRHEGSLDSNPRPNAKWACLAENHRGDGELQSGELHRANHRVGSETELSGFGVHRHGWPFDGQHRSDTRQVPRPVRSRRK